MSLRALCRRLQHAGSQGRAMASIELSLAGAFVRFEFCRTHLARKI
jgi:hypothetical protein